MPTLPRHIEQLAPDRLVIHGVSFLLVGMVFFLGGIALLWVIPDVDNGSAIFCGVMGTVVTVCGIVLLCGRSSTILDIAQRTVTKQWEILFPFYIRKSPIIDEMEVALYKDANADDTSYLVSLNCTRSNIVLYSSNKFDDSYATATAVAVFLNTSLRDITTEHPTETPPELLNTSLPQQLCDGSTSVGNAVPPPATRSKITLKDTGIEIILPPPGFGGILVLIIITIYMVFSGLVLIVAHGFGTFIVDTFIRLIHEHSWREVISFSVIPFILLSVLVWYILLATFGRTTITVNAGGITIAKRKVLFTKRTVLAVNDIIGLDYARYSGITVKTRRGFFSFAGGLSPEEVQYLYTLITQALTTRRDEAILGK